MNAPPQTQPQQRCAWAQKPIFHHYHDTEWGVPVHDDRQHFEMLVLETAQAGLSWETVLKKRAGYRRAFDNFAVQKIAVYDQAKQTQLLQDSTIIRNRLKIAATIKNAQAFIRIQEQLGSFDTYIWDFVNGTPIVNNWTTAEQIPASTALSDTVSKDLKQRGFSFVGTTIIYAHLQAVGIVNDHEIGCSYK